MIDEVIEATGQMVRVHQSIKEASNVGDDIPCLRKPAHISCNLTDGDETFVVYVWIMT